MVGCGAIDLRYAQRASGGTQKMLTARYSSGSSGSAPCAVCAASSACLASKASEMYLRKISPRTTCLYSAASMLLRSASAAAQSFDSNPRGAPLAKVVTYPDSCGLAKNCQTADVLKEIRSRLLSIQLKNVLFYCGQKTPGQKLRG